MQLSTSISTCANRRTFHFRSTIDGNKSNINADENLLAIFAGKNQISMFEMPKLINKHLS